MAIILSLNLRVLIAASAILSSFFGLAGITLDQIYRENAKQALEERLQGHVFELIAASSLDVNGNLLVPDEVPDSRFSDPSSGLFAQVVSNDRNWIWRSVSMRGISIEVPVKLSRTEQISKIITAPSGQQLYSFSYGVVWSDIGESGQAYTFNVIQNMSGFNANVADFRRSLWGSLGGVAILLLAVQGTILRWGLSPLKHAAFELTAIEAGKQSHLQGEYPSELEGLTNNINALLTHQQEHLERYRKTLGDLAHSLKTPLAILQAAIENQQNVHDLQIIVREQVERMNQITGYQLQRAATSGWTVLAAPIQVGNVINKILAGLGKVYADKNVTVTCDISNSLVFHGDESDLMEIIGNLTDNAFKWASHRVHVTAKNIEDTDSGYQGMLIQVEDDGSGVSEEMVHYVLQRGHRADSDVAGHGIGLSIVNDIVQLYEGKMEITKSKMGGAQVKITLPSHQPSNM